MPDLKNQEIAYGGKIVSGGPDSILSSFFRDILLDLKIDSNRFQAHLERYIYNRNPTINAVDMITARSALRRELLSLTMTWRVFIKGLSFLRVHKVIMTMALTHEDHSVSLHDYCFEIVDTDETEESEERNTLAKLFAQMLSDLEIDKDKYEQLLDDYVKLSKPNSTSVVQYTAKSSISREILKDSISWKVFIKGLMLLKTTKMFLHLELFRINRIDPEKPIITTHKKDLIFK